MPAVLAFRGMLLGYAIECSMKCYWVRQGNKMVENGKFVVVKGAGGDHNLVQLAEAVGFKATIRYDVTSLAARSGEESQKLKKGEISTVLTRSFTTHLRAPIPGRAVQVSANLRFSSAVLRCSGGRLHLEIKVAKS
jgi:hypothetical protein